jgi:drug/metabolite transporter (DMT)-like permease
MSIESAAAPRGTSATAAGIGMMVLGIFLFSVNDVMGKWLVATYSVGEVLLIRSLAALAALAPLIWRTGLAPFRFAPLPGLQLARVALGSVEVAFFYWAVVYLPLADVMTYYLAGPIYVAALAVPLLGERLDRRAFAVIGAGFVGVLIALNPSASSLSLPALIAIAGSVAFAFLMIVTRRLGGTNGVVLVTTQTLGALVLGAMLTPFGSAMPSPRDLGLLSLLGVVALVAHACVNRALQLAPASVVTPYQYTLIVWAVAFGWLVFGDVPRASMVIGVVVIIGAGLCLFVLERKRASGS